MLAGNAVQSYLSPNSGGRGRLLLLKLLLKCRLPRQCRLTLEASTPTLKHRLALEVLKALKPKHLRLLVVGKSCMVSVSEFALELEASLMVPRCTYCRSLMDWASWALLIA